MTGKPEITREQAGIAKKWQVGSCGLSILFQFNQANLCDRLDANGEAIYLKKALLNASFR